MHTRRSFVCRSAVSLAALALSPDAQASPAPDSAFGLQLYTVRKEIQADPAGVLAAVRKIGYRAVETFGGQYTMSAKELRKLITDAGLTVPSTHFTYTDLSDKFDYAKELGARYIDVGAPPFSIATSADGFKQIAAQYNQWGEKAVQYGLSFGFHNHNVEFNRFDGLTGLEILMRDTDPKLVKWQMDCYWVTEAGFDPLTLLRQYRSRIQTLHFKDRKKGFPTSTTIGKAAQHFTEVGAGTIDWKAIWNVAQAAGIPYFFVEQDTTEIPALDSVKISYDNLKRLLG